MKPTLYLIDASLYVFRAWHSMPPEFHDKDGAPINAVHGFTRFLCDFLERTRPTHVLVAFDESLTSSFRNGIYPEYKANRELPPQELIVQFQYCRRVAGALGLCVLADMHYEADDLIGSAVHVVRPQGFRAVIVSADKDFGQLISSDDELWDFSKDQRWDAHGVARASACASDQVADFRADRRRGRQHPRRARHRHEDRSDATGAFRHSPMRCSRALRKCPTCGFAARTAPTCG